MALCGQDAFLPHLRLPSIHHPQMATSASRVLYKAFLRRTQEAEKRTAPIGVRLLYLPLHLLRPTLADRHHPARCSERKDHESRWKALHPLPIQREHGVFLNYHPFCSSLPHAQNNPDDISMGFVHLKKLTEQVKKLPKTKQEIKFPTGTVFKHQDGSSDASTHHTHTNTTCYHAIWMFHQVRRLVVCHSS